MRLFRTRYRIEKNGREWLTVLCKKWYWKWTYVGVARDMEEAMAVIESHRSPIVWEE